MTEHDPAAQSPEPNGPSPAISVARCDLEDAATSRTDLARPRTIVSEARQRGSVVRAASGDARRIDYWWSADGLVTHGWRSDRSEPASAVTWPEEFAGAAILSLSDLPATGGPRPPGTASTTIPATLDELIVGVVRGAFGPDSSACTVERLTDGHADGLVRLDVDGQTRWAGYGRERTVAGWSEDLLGLALALHRLEPGAGAPATGRPQPEAQR